MQALFHPKTKKQIDTFLKSSSHALSLAGEQGSGKGYLATYIAQHLLESDSLDSHPYVFNLDGDAKAGIEDIRALKSFLTLKVPGVKAVKRVAIIENIDNLRHEAQNAMLKTLEETPEDTLIIVTYSKQNRLLSTIHSRMQRIDVLPLSLENVTKSLSGEFNKDLIIKSYYMSGGLAGLLSALLKDEVNHPLVSSIKQAREIISLNRYQRLCMVDKISKNADTKEVIGLLEGLYKLIEAAYKQGLKSQINETSINYFKRLKLIEESIADLHENLQVKLVLTRLFIQL